jgi:hypothetical protein
MNDNQIHLNLITDILTNAGFIAEVMGNQILVSLQNQSVSTIDIQKVLMRDEIDELVKIQYSYELQCVSVSI